MTKPLDRWEAVAALGGLRELEVDIFADSFPGDESIARQLAAARRLGWLEAEQHDLDDWTFRLTPEGRRLVGVFF